MNKYEQATMTSVQTAHTDWSDVSQQSHAASMSQCICEPGQTATARNDLFTHVYNNLGRLYRSRRDVGNQVTGMVGRVVVTAESEKRVAK